MDKKTVTGLILIILIMVGWSIFFMPGKEERKKQLERQQQQRDSIAEVDRQNRVRDSLAEIDRKNPPIDTNKLFQRDSTLSVLPDSIRKIKIDSIQQVDAAGKFGAFSEHAVGTDDFFIVENDKFVLKFLNRGGGLYSAKLKGYQTYFSRFIEQNNDTLDLMIGEGSGYAFNLSTDGKVFNTSGLYFVTPEGKTGDYIKVTGDEEKTLKLRAYANNNPEQYLEYSYTIPGNSFMIDFDVNFEGLDKVLDENQNRLEFQWGLLAPAQEKVITNERNNSRIHYRNMEGTLRGHGSKKKKVDDEIHWISYKQKFFSTVLIAKDGFKEPTIDFEVNKFNDEVNKVNTAYFSTIRIPFRYDQSQTFGMQMYLGPNHYNTLKKFKIGLQDQIDLGPFFLIKWINKGVMVVFNSFEKLDLGYGLIILLLTIIIKLITSPVTYKTFVSSAKTRILKPDIDELSKKFKPEEAMQKQQAIMQLYRRAGVNPLAGCIPALLQMPILLAMFSFFPAAIELRQQGFLWAEDFTTYDSIWNFGYVPLINDIYGDHVSLFTLLMTVTTILYTRMSSSQMMAGGGMQATQMKIMMYFMPLIFLGVLNSYSSALSYYYFLSNIVAIGITLVIRKFFVNEEKLRMVIDENKKRPAKKSKWQSRLEEMQKIRQEQVRQQQQRGKKRK